MTATFTKEARIAWLAIGGAIVVLLGFIIWHRTTAVPEEPVEIDDKTISAEAKPYLESTYPQRVSLAVPEGPTAFVERDEVRVKDQAAGARVFVSQVSLTRSGWVAVRDVDAMGAYGNILGAARFDAGVWQGEVLLLRPIVTGERYAAVLYADDGDGSFDYQKDTIILFEDAPVGMIFSVY